MKYFRLIVIGLFVALFAGAILWQARIFFLQNKVTFLLNQRQFESAESLVERLRTLSPDDLRTEALYLKTLTLTNQYGDVTRTTVTEALADESPDVLYWVALAHFQNGNLVEAQHLAKTFLSTRESLPDQASMEVVGKLAGSANPVKVTDKDDDAIKLLFPLEQAIYLSYAAVQEMNLNQMAVASDLFARAFALGLRNKQMLLKACEAAALSGNGFRAEMFFAYSGETTISGLYEKLVKTYTQYKDVTKAIHDREVGGGGRLSVAYALSWAGTLLLSENVTSNMYPILRIMADLQQEYPYDRVLKGRMAVVLELLGRFDESYKIYEELFADAPNLVTALRMWCLESLGEDEIAARLSVFIKDVSPLQELLPNDLVSAGNAQQAHVLTFHQSGEATGTITVPATGTYMVTLVARGDKAFSKWPLLKVTVGDKPPENLYICRDCWDCYSFTAVLEEGRHKIEIDYVNDRDSIADNSEDRSFYLKEIFVTKPGGE